MRDVFSWQVRPLFEEGIQLLHAFLLSLHPSFFPLLFPALSFFEVFFLGHYGLNVHLIEHLCTGRCVRVRVHKRMSETTFARMSRDTFDETGHIKTEESCRRLSGAAGGETSITSSMFSTKVRGLLERSSSFSRPEDCPQSGASACACACARACLLMWVDFSVQGYACKIVKSLAEVFASWNAIFNAPALGKVLMIEGATRHARRSKVLHAVD